jgi:hypothetical protein
MCFHAQGRKQAFLFVTQDDIFSDGQWLNQHEMLMNHADAGPDGLAGRRETDWCSFYLHAAGCRLMHAVDDSRKRAFPCAVFSYNRMNRTSFNCKIDVPVCQEQPERFCDA